MMRPITTFFLSLLGSVLLWSCCPEDPFIPTKPDIPFDSSKQAYLRVVIADPDISPVNVLIDGEAMFSAPLGFFDYPEAVYEAQFWPVDTAADELAFALPGGNELASIPVSWTKNSYQTAYLYRDGTGHKIILTSDDPKASVPNDQVRYRIVNLSLESPSVDIIFTDKTSGNQYTVSDLGYGDTTEFLTQPAALQKELLVRESGTQREIIGIPSVLLPGGGIVTLVMTGRLRPRGDEKFIYFNNFTDSRLDNETGLYGGLPFRVELTSLRFINLVGYADSTLDLALEDKRFGGDFPDSFRRNFPGQNSVIAVAPLGSDPTFAEKGYFFLSTLLYVEFPYRVEVHRLDVGITGQKQTVLVERKPLPVEANRRYTVVAFGPFVPGQADAVTLFDRTPSPPAGQVNARFFHGAYGALQNERLRLRINGVTSPEMGYGQAPDPLTQWFTLPASGSATIEVLNQAGAVVHTQTGVQFSANKTYTIFLSRGPNGDALLVKAVADDVVP